MLKKYFFTLTVTFQSQSWAISKRLFPVQQGERNHDRALKLKKLEITAKSKARGAKA